MRTLPRALIGWPMPGGEPIKWRSTRRSPRGSRPARLLRAAKLAGPDRDSGRLADAEMLGTLGRVRSFSRDIRDRLRRREVVGEDGGEMFEGDGRELWSTDAAETMLLRFGAAIGARLAAEAQRRSDTGSAPSWASVADAKAEATASAAGLWYRREVCHCPLVLGIRSVRPVALVPLADGAGVVRLHDDARPWRSASFLRLWRSSTKAARRVLGGFRDGGRTGRKGDTGRGVDVPFDLSMASGYGMDGAEDVAALVATFFAMPLIAGAESDDDDAEAAASAAGERVGAWLADLLPSILPTGTTGADATRRKSLRQQGEVLRRLASGEPMDAAALAAGYASGEAAALALRRGDLLAALCAASAKSHPERRRLLAGGREAGRRVNVAVRAWRQSPSARWPACAIASAVRAREAVRAWDKWSAAAWSTARLGLRAGYLRA